VSAIETSPTPLRTVDVAALSGASYRQLDYWCSEGLVPGQPADVGTGNRRQWTYDQLRHVRCLAALTAAGVNGRDLRHASARLAEPDLDWDAPLELDHIRYVRLSLDLPSLL